MHLNGLHLHIGQVKVLQSVQGEKRIVGKVLNWVPGKQPILILTNSDDFDFIPGKRKVSQPGHYVPDHVGRGGEVVVGQVQRPQPGHVGQG